MNKMVLRYEMPIFSHKHGQFYLGSHNIAFSKYYVYKIINYRMFLASH